MVFIVTNNIYKVENQQMCKHKHKMPSCKENVPTA